MVEMPDAQADLFAAPPAPPETFEVHLCPPDYPDACFPGRCPHDPAYRLCADARIGRDRRGRPVIEIDHSVCLACGIALESTYGGNVLVDLRMLLASRAAVHPGIRRRLCQLLARWSRLAAYLFDERGWCGRHRALARRIDPRLTMRLELLEPGEVPVRLARLHFDPEYLRPEPPNGDRRPTT